MFHLNQMQITGLSLGLSTKEVCGGQNFIQLKLTCKKGTKLISSNVILTTKKQQIME